MKNIAELYAAYKELRLRTLLSECVTETDFGLDEEEKKIFMREHVGCLLVVETIGDVEVTTAVVGVANKTLRLNSPEMAKLSSKIKSLCSVMSYIRVVIIERLESDGVVWLPVND